MSYQCCRHQHLETVLPPWDGVQLKCASCGTVHAERGGKALIQEQLRSPAPPTKKGRR